MAIAVWTSFQQIADGNGTPYSGALVNVYAAGTTTPLTLYSDPTLSTTADNPIECDSSGQHAMRYIATASYKTTVTTAAGAALSNWSKDNIDPGVAVGSGALPVANGGTGGTTAAAARTNLAAASATDMSTAQSDISNLQTWAGYNLTTKSRMATGTTAQQPAASTAGGFRFDSTLVLPLVDNGAAWKKIAIEGKIDSSYMAASSGIYLLQRTITSVGTTQSITATTPAADSSIPQIGEGTEVTNWNVNFTPKNANSKIIVTVDAECGSSATANDRIMSLFKDGAANAVRSTYQKTNVAAITNFKMQLRYEFSPGATTLINFAVRAGVSSGTLYINTDGNSVTLGAVRESFLIIEEWLEP